MTTAPTPKNPPPVPTTPPRAQVWRVVVIEDNAEDRAEARRLLLKGSERRYQFVEAETGAAGVRAVLDAPAAPPDCVVLDYYLPDMDAPEVLAALTGPDGMTVCPVLVFTGSAAADIGRGILRAGAQDYIGKDCLTAAGLTRAVENAAERWKMAREMRVQQAALKSSEDRFRLAAEALNGIIYDCDLTTGHVERTRGLYEVVGYRPDEVPPTAAWWREQTHPDDREANDELYANLVGDSVVNGYRVRHRDGRWLHVEDRAVLVRGDDGQPVRMVGCTVDVTARKEAVAGREQTLATLNSLVDSAPVGIVLLDSDMRYRHINGPLAEMNGLPPEAHIGKTVGQVVPDLYEQVEPLFRKVLGEGVAIPDFVLEGETPKAPGVKRAWRESWFPVAGPDGRPSGVGAIVQEVTEQRRAEEALRASEAFNRSLMEGSTDCVKVLDVGGRLLHMNEPGRCLMEIDDLGPLCGREWTALWPAECQEDIRRAVATACGGDCYSFQAFCPTAKGTPKWWDVIVSPVLDVPKGRVVRLLSVSRDITERKQAEAELRDGEQRMRLATEATGVGIWHWNVVTGRIRWDAQMFRIYGVTPTSDGFVEYGTWSGAVLPEDLPRQEEVLQETVRCRGNSSREFRIRREGDGECRVVRSVETVRTDGHSQVEWVVGTNLDITEQRQSETALKASEVRYRRLFESAKDGILILDAHAATITDANPFIVEMLGYSRGELLGKELWQIGVFRDAAASKAAVRELQETGYIRYEDLPLETKAGRRVNVEFVSNVYGEDGHAVIQCNIRDVSDRKRLEETLRRHAADLSEADLRKDEFLATLAHELRNPLAPIRNGLAVLQKTRSPEQTDKVVGMMGRQLGHMVNLVDDLLDVSRVRTGKITLRIERVTAREAIDAAVEACRPTIDAKGHRLEVDLPAEPLPLDGDRTRLVQVLANLLTNAAKYSEPGGRIRVAAAREGNEAVVRVSDAGMGIAPELIPTLWDMFTQVRDTLDKAQGGLGIGLSLVKKLVQMHGGTVAAESAGVGLGSTFTVRLPVAGARAGVTEIPPSPHRNGSAPARPAGRRILVVDDNVDGAESLATLLDYSGHETRVCHSGPDALAAAREFAPEVALLDIGLPGLDGYEVARRLRADPATAGIVLVALTGWGSDDDKRKSKDAGFDFHLTKPAGVKAVQDVLAQSSPPRVGVPST